LEWEVPANGFFHSEPRLERQYSLSCHRCSRRRVLSLRPAPRPRVLLRGATARVSGGALNPALARREAQAGAPTQRHKQRTRTARRDAHAPHGDRRRRAAPPRGKRKGRRRARGRSSVPSQKNAFVPMLSRCADSFAAIAPKISRRALPSPGSWAQAGRVRAFRHHLNCRHLLRCGETSAAGATHSGCDTATRIRTCCLHAAALAWRACVLHTQTRVT
jgi:hypothetical protein